MRHSSKEERKILLKTIDNDNDNENESETVQ